MTPYESLYCDIKYELDNVKFGHGKEEQRSFHYIVSILEGVGNRHEISGSEVGEMLKIVYDDTDTLMDAYCKLIDYIDKKIAKEGQEAKK